MVILKDKLLVTDWWWMAGGWWVTNCAGAVFKHTWNYLITASR